MPLHRSSGVAFHFFFLRRINWSVAFPLGRWISISVSLMSNLASAQCTIKTLQYRSVIVLFWIINNKIAVPRFGRWRWLHIQCLRFALVFHLRSFCCNLFCWFDRIRTGNHGAPFNNSHSAVFHQCATARTTTIFKSRIPTKSDR